MAVSLNTSTSRSDFMISDAAIPKRMEELEQAEQSNAFADILGGIGVQTVNADSDSADLQAMQLIQAVANGEMTLDDVNMELIPEDVFKRIAELLMPNSEDSDEETADMQNVAAELAAMFIAQPEVIADDKSAELTELTGAAVETVDTFVTEAATVTAEIPVQDMAEQIPAEQFAAEQTEAVTEAVAEQVIPTTEQTAQAAQAPKAEVRQKPEAKQAGESKPNAEIQAAEQQTEIPVQTNEQTEGDGFNQTMQRSETPAQIRSEQPEQAEQKLFESAELTVTERKEQPETSQQTEAPAIRTAAVSERVVEKSDELIMLKNAVKRTPTEAGAEQIRADIPVNVPAAQMPVVKPTEVLEQVEVKLTELVQQAKQGVTEYTLTLNPEELGKITVKMTKASDGAVSVSIAAENSRTQRILEENGAMLQSSLRQHGVQLESWQTVNESQQDMHAEDYRGSRGNQYQGEERRENPETDDGESFSEIIANM